MLPAAAFFERGEHPLAGGRLLLVPQRALDAAPAGAHRDQVLAGLSGAQGDAFVAQRRGELRRRPGAVLVEQAVEGGDHLRAPGLVLGRTRATAP